MSRTVEPFSLTLDGWNDLLDAPDPNALLEQRLLSRLENPERLLRWAVVAVEDERSPRPEAEAERLKSSIPRPEAEAERSGQQFRCEGAYLRA